MSKNNETFVAMIGCMDGRGVRAREKFLMKDHGGAFGDAICKGPGVVQVIAATDHPDHETRMEEVVHNFKISYEKHGSRALYVSGHEECAGFPVETKEHISGIVAAATNLRERLASEGYSDVYVGGLFHYRDANHDWTTRVVSELEQTQEVPMAKIA